MPAARPSQASLSNAISAVITAGLIPGALHVHGDGSFRIEISVSDAIDTKIRSEEAFSDEPERFEDLR
ncbi:hypothetical protein SAMN04488040_0245 [Sulfitobacter marinus]|jgi:hypothetical protein|uniref:Uncharacterized protein n=1 Tax=Sulfitobacter marinus TaxID=394264 RepID=A0A1I6PMY0_9RHOB|nr:hypothetical protein SAMN04488040_0245 [Sulfitobacter marinus]